uniref:Uncharacterized protein n=1 Tax=Amphimedon queenslandica TaxID=400682 RepID=A0A1X7VMW3_AMPQE
NISSVDYSII